MRRRQRPVIVEPPARLRSFVASDWTPLVDPAGYTRTTTGTGRTASRSGSRTGAPRPGASRRTRCGCQRGWTGGTSTAGPGGATAVDLLKDAHLARRAAHACGPPAKARRGQPRARTRYGRGPAHDPGPLWVGALSHLPGREAELRDQGDALLTGLDQRRVRDHPATSRRPPRPAPPARPTPRRWRPRRWTR